MTIATEDLARALSPGTLLPYDDLEQALSIAHDSPSGLHAAVFGPPTQAINWRCGFARVPSR